MFSSLLIITLLVNNVYRLNKAEKLKRKFEILALPMSNPSPSIYFSFTQKSSTVDQLQT